MSLLEISGVCVQGFARQREVGFAERLGLDYVRADTVGPDPRFISMIGEFVEAYAGGLGDLSAMGCGDNGSTCRDRCCVPAARPRSAARPSDRA